MSGIVDSLCDLTGNMVRPWAEAGYDCNCYDLQRRVPDVEWFPGGGLIRHWQFDVTMMRSRGDCRPRAAVFCFPPCTHLAVSGALHFRRRGLRSLIEALVTVEACRDYAESTGAPWMLENPISVLSSWWREPDIIFDPFEYATYLGGDGDNYTKGTCLWTGGGFVMPEKRPEVSMPLFGVVATEPDDRIHKMAPGPERANLRSATPRGFARAVFEANALRRTAIPRSH